MIQPVSVPTSRGLIEACLARRLSLTAQFGHEKYPDPWPVFAARYGELIAFALSRFQVGAGAAVRNLQPDDILTAIYKKFSSVKLTALHAEGSFRAWLGKVVRCAVIDEYRRQRVGVNKSTAALEEIDLEPLANEIAEMFDHEEVEGCFARALDEFCKQLDAPWKETVVHLWVARRRDDADSESGAHDEIEPPETYRAIANRYGVKLTTVYAFTKTMPEQVLELFEKELAQLDQFDGPENPNTEPSDEPK